MFKHTLWFASLSDKRDAIDHVSEGVQIVGEIDEHLTEKKVSFLTDIELSKRTRRSLLLDTGAVEHLEEEM